MLNQQCKAQRVKDNKRHNWLTYWNTRVYKWTRDCVHAHSVNNTLDWLAQYDAMHRRRDDSRRHLFCRTHRHVVYKELKTEIWNCSDALHTSLVVSPVASDKYIKNIVCYIAASKHTARWQWRAWWWHWTVRWPEEHKPERLRCLFVFLSLTQLAAIDARQFPTVIDCWAEGWRAACINVGL